MNYEVSGLSKVQTFWTHYLSDMMKQKHTNKTNANDVTSLKSFAIFMFAQLKISYVFAKD